MPSKKWNDWTPRFASLGFPHGAWSGVLPALLWVAVAAAQEDVEYLSDPAFKTAMTHQQAWGDFGLDTAAARPGTSGTPLQIGTKTFSKGLGHHANGEIVVSLRRQYKLFRAQVGVQWQGGGRGSVKFQVLVDNKSVWQAGPVSDSDPPQAIEIPVEQAMELRLVASDAGDGIGCDMANWVEACLVRDPRVLQLGQPQFSLGDGGTPTTSACAGGFAVVTGATGPQIAVMDSASTWTFSVGRGEEARFSVGVRNMLEPLRIAADVRLIRGEQAEVELSLGPKRVARSMRHGDEIELLTEPLTGVREAELTFVVRGADVESGVRCSRLRFVFPDREVPVQLAMSNETAVIPPPVLPDLRPSLEQELVEWDWRMQDGIGTDRESRSFADAIRLVFDRGDQLVRNLSSRGVAPAIALREWEDLRKQLQTLDPAGRSSDWMSLWRRVHELRRRLVVENPLVPLGPLVFVKNVPSSFSHQLTQYSGPCARPGGGLFVLEEPGVSMRCRQLTPLPAGSCMHPDVAWDGSSVLFAYCKIDPDSTDWRTNTTQHYHLYEVKADGSSLRQLTDADYDDFAPRYLPDGKILFLSTRRGGFHRCGRGPCPVHTLSLANRDGTDPRVISFHETHEWDPAVLNDGRIIYTRWDYVDRHAVYYQQLWSVRADGTDVRAFYGNNTLNPVGVWEARPIPGSHSIIATAGAHHAMTAGSVILIDPARGLDGLEPITRLTPDALFPESEFPVGSWHAPAGVPEPPDVPVEERRWPGHCYRAPYPLSEDSFLASYSYEPLIGEPSANRPNMFGIYLMDRFGNKELIYRDVSISSLWAIPLRSRPTPPASGGEVVAATTPGEGTFLLQNVYESWPNLSAAKGSVKRLRILQVLPKTTPNANDPRVGLAFASPGKQVLGTVPVEADGSAYFRAPSGVPLSFQALDEQGMAIQTMRSLTYLQPGEHSSCVGCHEYRTSAPPATATTVALAGLRPPSEIAPGPDGSKPFNYAILVQPVLDKHCVRCHEGANAEGKVDLTGAPAGEFTVSYNALAPRVPFSEWKGAPKDNSEPQAKPNTFGARASSLTPLLLKGHEDVSLSKEEIERLVTWMDANALFYGTFRHEDQKRQQRGERIAGPELQ